MPYSENDNSGLPGDLNYDFNNLIDLNNLDNLNAEETDDIEIEIRLSRGQIITIGDCPTKLNPDPPAKYAGKFLYKIENNTLVMGVCAEKRKTAISDIEYIPGDAVAVSYIMLRSRFLE